MNVTQLSEKDLNQLPKEYNFIYSKSETPLAWILTVEKEISLYVRVNDWERIKFPRVSTGEFFLGHPLIFNKTSIGVFVKVKDTSQLLRLKILITSFFSKVEYINPWRVYTDDINSILFLREDLKIFVFKTDFLNENQLIKFKNYLIGELKNV